MKNMIRTTILCLGLAAFSGSALGDEAPPSTKVIQELTALSSSQFYTNFALTRSMLEGTWDQKVFKQFSSYDGLNLQMMKRYGDELKEDKKWGPFLTKKNALHLEIYEKLQPLIEKKKAGEELTKADQGLLEDLDKKILENLMK